MYCSLRPAITLDTNSLLTLGWMFKWSKWRRQVHCIAWRQRLWADADVHHCAVLHAMGTRCGMMSVPFRLSIFPGTRCTCLLHLLQLNIYPRASREFGSNVTAAAETSIVSALVRPDEISHFFTPFHSEGKRKGNSCLRSPLICATCKLDPRLNLSWLLLSST